MTMYKSIQVQVATVFANLNSLRYELKLQNPKWLDLASIDNLEKNWPLLFFGTQTITQHYSSRLYFTPA